MLTQKTDPTSKAMKEMLEAHPSYFPIAGKTLGPRLLTAEFIWGCGGLNENGPNRFTCLNTWFPVRRNVWEGAEGVVSLG